jgi:hypothetical protein
MKGRRMKSSRLSSDIARPVSRRTLLLSMQSSYRAVAARACSSAEDQSQGQEEEDAERDRQGQAQRGDHLHPHRRRPQHAVDEGEAEEETLRCGAERDRAPGVELFALKALLCMERVPAAAAG